MKNNRRNRSRESKQRRTPYYWKMTVSNDRCDRLLCMSKAPNLEIIWDDWAKIADQVIPQGYDLRDCLGGIDFNPNYSDISVQNILRRIEYLSDRLDPARCFALYYRIRRHLRLGQR